MLHQSSFGLFSHITIPQHLFCTETLDPTPTPPLSHLKLNDFFCCFFHGQCLDEGLNAQPFAAPDLHPLCDLDICPYFPRTILQCLSTMLHTACSISLHASLQKLSVLLKSRRNQSKRLQDLTCHYLLALAGHPCFHHETVLSAVAATLWGTHRSRKGFPVRVPLVVPHTLQHLALGKCLLCLCFASPVPLQQSDPRHGSQCRHHFHSLFTKVVFPLFISNLHTRLLQKCIQCHSWSICNLQSLCQSGDRRFHWIDIAFLIKWPDCWHFMAKCALRVAPLVKPICPEWCKASESHQDPH